MAAADFYDHFLIGEEIFSAWDLDILDIFHSSHEIDLGPPSNNCESLSVHAQPHTSADQQMLLSSQIFSPEISSDSDKSVGYQGYEDDLGMASESGDAQFFATSSGTKRPIDGDDRTFQPNKKRSKVEKEGESNETQKIIIHVRSEEPLEDGYRWRKYGVKSMKNCVEPRCYYKCSDKRCSVKKRVERKPLEPEIMVVTYEGIHNHKCPNPVCYVERRVYVPVTSAAL